jgi:hypothetical protein
VFRAVAVAEEAQAGRVPAEQEAVAVAQVVLEVPEVDRAPQWMPAVCGALRGKVVVAAAEPQELGVAAVPDSTVPVVHQVPVQKEEEGRRLGSGSRRQLCSGRAQLQVAVAG